MIVVVPALFTSPTAHFIIDRLRPSCLIEVTTTQKNGLLKGRENTQNVCCPLLTAQIMEVESPNLMIYKKIFSPRWRMRVKDT